MFGLIGTAIFLGALGVSSAKAGLDNMDCMSKPLYITEKGYKVYMDRQGKEYINGNLVYRYPGVDQYGHSCTVLRDKKGNIYSSSADQTLNRMREFDKKYYQNAKEIAEKFGQGDYFVYQKYFPEYQKNLYVESTTGRPVTRMKVDFTKYSQTRHLGIKYYKIYFHDGQKSHWEESDKVEVTKEIYDRIWD